MRFIRSLSLDACGVLLQADIFTGAMFSLIFSAGVDTKYRYQHHSHHGYSHYLPSKAAVLHSWDK
jgi:hypothetical protein